MRAIAQFRIHNPGRITRTDWCEISLGRDFFKARGKWDWIITNPPFSLFTEFLAKGCEVADNVVFLSLLPTWFMDRKLKELRDQQFGIVEILRMQQPPKPWPTFGYAMAAVHVRRFHKGPIKYSIWEGVPMHASKPRELGLRPPALQEPPQSLADRIVEHFQPEGAILEPSTGRGAFMQALKRLAKREPGRVSKLSAFELSSPRGFLHASGKWDWVITAPPRNRFLSFLNKGCQVSNDLVFLESIPGWFTHARLRALEEQEFGIKEILYMKTPREWFQSGAGLGAVHIQRFWKGNIAFSTLEEKPTKSQAALK